MKSFFAGIAFLSYGLTLAQPVAIGKATEVDGLVTVSDGATVSTVGRDHAVLEGSRFVTSSTGRVTLVFENGCELRLKPNQFVTIQAGACDALTASVQTLSDPALFVEAATSPTSVPGVGSLMSNPTVNFLTVAGVAIVDMRSTGKANLPLMNSPISGQ